jgi:hypothetical protein
MMRKQGRIIAMLSVAALTVATARMAQHLWSTQRRVHAAVAGTRPNIIMILADDLGYADISAYKIDRFHTPNIDRIRKRRSYAKLRSSGRWKEVLEPLLGTDVPGVTERFAAAYMFANAKRRWL